MKFWLTDQNFDDNTLLSNSGSLKGKFSFYSKKELSFCSCFIHSVWTHEFLYYYFYFIQCVRAHCTMFDALIVQDLASRVPSDLWWCHFVKFPLFLENHHAFLCHKTVQAYFAFSHPQPWYWSFFNNLSSFYGKIVFSINK